MADTRGLATAYKKDSQGICFVGSVGIKDFLGQYVTTTPGIIIEKETGTTIGYHEGALFYTIGQRHGLNIGGGLPYYVVGKDMNANEVYVSRNLNDESMWRRNLILKDIHFINQPAELGKQLHVRLRHRGALLPCRLEGSTLHLDQPERAVAAGQSAVLYDGELCLGGGIID